MHSWGSEHSRGATGSRSDRHGASTGKWLLDGYDWLCHWSLFFFRSFLSCNLCLTLLRNVHDLLFFNFCGFFLFLGLIFVRVDGLIEWDGTIRLFCGTCLLCVIFFILKSHRRLYQVLAVWRILHTLRVLHVLCVVLTSRSNIRHSLTKHAFESTEVSTTTIILILIHLGDRLALLIGHSHWLWSILNHSGRLLMTIVLK